MGHYDSAYEDLESKLAKDRTASEMKAKRKTIKNLDEFTAHLKRTGYHSFDIPDRFKWALEDFRNWLNNGLDEWERENLLNLLKGK